MGWPTSTVQPWTAALTKARQAWAVDVRVKTFASEAADRLGFLPAEFGFTGPVPVRGENGPYPLLLRVRFARPGLSVEISLVLSYMGEEYVAADLVAEDESGWGRRTEIGRGTAHTGYQMRHALARQAHAVRRALGGHAPVNST
jgi:hypothetical protein